METDNVEIAKLKCEDFNITTKQGEQVVNCSVKEGVVKYVVETAGLGFGQGRDMTMYQSAARSFLYFIWAKWKSLGLYVFNLYF